MNEKDRVRELKESVFILNNLHEYYRQRINPKWLTIQRGKRDAAIALANEQYATAKATVAEAEAKIETTAKNLRLAEGELKKLTSDKKVNQMLKLQRQIAALQRAIQELSD